MNLELILAFIVGAIIGGGITFKLLPGFLKSIFRETARDELSEIQNEIADDKKQNEDDLSKRLEALNTAIIKASSTWDANTKNLAQEVGDLTRSHTQWAEALSNPGEQGILAEEGLEVMLEAAGLIKGISFDTQITEHADDGGVLRPDFYVYTPEEGVIIIDSKAPMTHYKNAIQADNETEKREALNNHANSMYNYARQLGQRDYTQATSRNTPDMVIMYVPNLAVYLAAIEARPTLIEEAWSHKVQICPPEAIYPVLKSIMLSWQQKKLYDNAAEIQKQTKIAHERVKVFYGHSLRL